MSAFAYSRVVAALEAHGCTSNGRGMWTCPTHDDSTPSLSVTDRPDRPDRALVHCHGTCDTIDVLDRINLSWADLFDDPADGKHWQSGTLKRLGARCNGDGRVELGGVRYLPKGEPKTLAVKGSKRDLWPDPATVEGSTLYVVEGEPDAVTASQLGLPAVAVPGTGKWVPEWAERLARGRGRVVIVSDCDEPGRTAAAKWAAAIGEHCQDVRVLDLQPDRGDGHDLSDWAADAVTDEDRAAAGGLVRRAAQLTGPFVAGGARVQEGVQECCTLANDAVEPNVGGARSARTLGAPGLLAPPKLRLLDVEGMLATEPPPVPWTVEPLLAQGCVTMLAGREGQGKSMLALALASAIGHGSTVVGLECQPGTVLYVDAENGEREAHRRVRGLGVKPGTLQYVEAVGFNLAEDIGLVADLVDEHRPSVVVLDSLRSLAPGLDENDSRPAEAALRPVSRLAMDKGIPILLLAHAGKQGIEYRGSTAIGAAVEIGFTLSRHEDDPEKLTRRKLACWKSRPAPEPAPRWISLESRDGMVLLGATEPFEASRSGRPSRERDETSDKLLAALDGKLTAWPDWARAAGLDPKHGTPRHARDDLADRGLVIVAQDLWRRAASGGGS